MEIVILAGGSGTRFWPLSREATPKQFLAISGDTTMIQQTVTRFEQSAHGDNIYIVTGKKYAYDINRQIFQVLPKKRFEIIVEPTAKNTAPAVGLAAVRIFLKKPDAVMIVMPSDHLIRRNDLFVQTALKAESLARKGFLTTIGIKPVTPETGYGYIKRGAAFSDEQGKAFHVESFVEKPTLQNAQAYLETGLYYWNSGIFVWRISDLLSAFEQHMPALYHGLMEIQKHIGLPDETEVIKEVFEGLDSVSIDKGVMEKASNVAVTTAEFDWNDVGSWTALDQIFPKDDRGNIKAGNVINIDSEDSILYADRRLVATIGLKDIIVVDTPDATLVSSKDRAQDVKQVVDILKNKGAEECNTHLTVDRPWGSYTVLEEGARYKIKRIVVSPGARLSRQMHHHRSEHWVVVAGTALITVGGKTFNIHPNESAYVPMSTEHRIENPGKLPLHIIEVQNGEYIKEDDIVRFDDDFGRDLTPS